MNKHSVQVFGSLAKSLSLSLFRKVSLQPVVHHPEGFSCERMTVFRDALPASSRGNNEPGMSAIDARVRSDVMKLCSSKSDMGVRLERAHALAILFVLHRDAGHRVKVTVEGFLTNL